MTKSKPVGMPNLTPRLTGKTETKKIMKNEEMELVNDNGTWKIKWNDGFERSFESFFKAKLHFVALVNQQIAMER